MKESHNEKPKGRKGQPKFKLYVNALPVEDVPRSIPVKFISYDEIKKVEQQEVDGKRLTVKYVVMRTVIPSPGGGKDSIDLLPLRNSAGDYLVIVCFRD